MLQASKVGVGGEVMAAPGNDVRRAILRLLAERPRELRDEPHLLPRQKRIFRKPGMETNLPEILPPTRPIS